MNYLVHLYLAGEDPELQLGSLMGDFVKGPIPADYPEKLALGLHLHRALQSRPRSYVKISIAISLSLSSIPCSLDSTSITTCCILKILRRDKQLLLISY